MNDDSAPTELDDEAVRQLRRSGLRSAPSPRGQHEAPDHDGNDGGRPRRGSGGPEAPAAHRTRPGPITGDPDPIEGSGRGSLVLLVILAVIGVLLIGTIIAQFAGVFG
jgi:hypothetical protein